MREEYQPGWVGGGVAGIRVLAEVVRSVESKNLGKLAFLCPKKDSFMLIELTPNSLMVSEGTKKLIERVK